MEKQDIILTQLMKKTLVKRAFLGCCVRESQKRETGGIINEALMFSLILFWSNFQMVRCAWFSALYQNKRINQGSICAVHFLRGDVTRTKIFPITKHMLPIKQQIKAKQQNKSNVELQQFSYWIQNLKVKIWDIHCFQRQLFWNIDIFISQK